MRPKTGSASIVSLLPQTRTLRNVFIPKALGLKEEDDFVDSEDPDYVMQRIRNDYLEDSSVTVVLIGACTHGRRFIDWELKGSLLQPQDGLPNGLLGILLPPLTQGARLPDRFELNRKSGYASYHRWPTSSQELKLWIEEAYDRRVSKAHLIENPRDMMGYNSRCLVHGITHEP